MSGKTLQEIADGMATYVALRNLASEMLDVIDAARVLLGSLPGTSDKDELRFRSALTDALAALDAKVEGKNMMENEQVFPT